jgi:acid stress-induced BolA-like protein IbaG/YrbA
MSHHFTTFEGSVTDAIQKAIEDKIEGAIVTVTGGGGHYQIEVTSAVFEGKNMVQSQRLVYGAIAHLMQGESAPVHAVDTLRTKTP